MAAESTSGDAGCEAIVEWGVSAAAIAGGAMVLSAGAAALSEARKMASMVLAPASMASDSRLPWVVASIRSKSSSATSDDAADNGSGDASGDCSGDESGGGKSCTSRSMVGKCP